jgi:hypothetical protein
MREDTSWVHQRDCCSLLQETCYLTPQREHRRSATSDHWLCPVVDTVLHVADTLPGGSRDTVTPLQHRFVWLWAYESIPDWLHQRHQATECQPLRLLQLLGRTLFRSASPAAVATAAPANLLHAVP